MKTSCVIMAAGHGKRMRSGLLKVLHPLADQPMIDYPVELAFKLRWSPVVVVVGHQREALVEHLRERFGERLAFAVQDPPQGTGHAVLQAEPLLRGFHGKVAILSGDVPLLEAAQLRALVRAGRRAPLAFLTLRLPDPGRYGRVIRDEQGRVDRIVEHADADPATRQIDEVNTGIYLVEKKFLFEALRSVRSENSQGEYYLTDLVASARERGLPIAGLEVGDAEAVLGVNDRLDLAAAERELNRRTLERLMRSGVTVVDPARTRVGHRVRIGADTLLEPGADLRGATVVGPRCRIGPGAVVEDCRLGDEVEVRAYSVLRRARLRTREVVGPHASIGVVPIRPANPTNSTGLTLSPTED